MLGERQRGGVRQRSVSSASTQPGSSAYNVMCNQGPACISFTILHHPQQYLQTQNYKTAATTDVTVRRLTRGVSADWNGFGNEQALQGTVVHAFTQRFATRKPKHHSTIYINMIALVKIQLEKITLQVHVHAGCLHVDETTCV